MEWKIDCLLIFSREEDVQGEPNRVECDPNEVMVLGMVKCQYDFSVLRILLVYPGSHLTMLAL